MLEKFIFNSPDGSSLHFGEPYVYYSQADVIQLATPNAVGYDVMFCLLPCESKLHDYAFTTKYTNEKISGVVASKKRYPMQVEFAIIKNNGKYNMVVRLKILNYIRSRLLKGITKKAYANIEIDGWKMDCFCVGVDETEYLQTKSHIRLVLTIETDRPYWYRNREYTLSQGMNNVVIPWSIEPLDVDISWEVYGAYHDDAYLEIGGKRMRFCDILYNHEYLENGEKLVWDSVGRKIQKHKSDGSIRNKFGQTICCDVTNSDIEIYRFAPISGSAREIVYNGFYGKVTRTVYSPYPRRGDI